MAPSQDSQSDFSIYSPIDKATRSIRLLCFTEPPVNSLYSLHFTLEIHKLPTEDEQDSEDNLRTKFIALSYMWGKPAPECLIIVNSQCLKIRENLYTLLRALYTKKNILGKYPYLWADAICIDQESIEEKIHQVNMMGDIYLQADCVVAWLGPAADQSRLAMKTLANASYLEENLESLEPEAVNALLALLNRPYWKRLWIVQEFTLAKRLLLFCGNICLSLNDTRGGERLDALNFWRAGNKTAAASFLSSRTNWQNNEELSDLHSIVHEFKDQGCEQRRDRVFALLALYYQKARSFDWKFDCPRITADYRVQPERLFYRVLGQCRRDTCYEEEDAERELQEALDVPDCEVESVEAADRFVDSVSGFQDYWSLEKKERRRIGNVTAHGLIEKGVIRERGVDEVIGHLKALTGLEAEEIHNDPEGTYLEVMGRLRNYRRYQVEGKYREYTERGQWILDEETWEAFKDALKRSLGMSRRAFY